MSLREQYPGLAPTYAIECLEDIQNIYSLFMQGIAERTEALALVDLVELANSQQISSSRYVKPLNGCPGSLSAMHDLIGFHNELRPNDSHELVRDQVGEKLEEAGQLVVSRQIVSKVIKEIDSPGEITDATLASLQDYLPYSLTVLESTAQSLSDAHVSRYQLARDGNITTNSALAFAHLAALQKITISSGGRTEEISLRQYKLDLVLKERADMTEYLRKTDGNDEGSKTIIKGIDDLAARALDVRITDADRPSLVRLGIIATGKITIETARIAAKNKNKAAAVVALSGIAIGLVGVQPAAAKPNHDKALNWEKKINESDNYHKFETSGVVKFDSSTPASLYPKAPGKHANEVEAKAINKENYKGHKLTPEIREALNEIIARDNPWKNRGIALLFFMERDFTLEQASGMVANFMVESKMPGSNIDVNPRAIQVGGPGRGIAQTEKKHGNKGGRWDELVKFAIRNNMDPWELSTQLKFVMYEFDHTERKAYFAMRASRGVSEATIDFLREYERAGDPHGTRRLENGDIVFNEVLNLSKAISKRNDARGKHAAEQKPPLIQSPPAMPPTESAPVIPEPSISPSAPIVSPSQETPVIPDVLQDAPVIPDEEQLVYPVDIIYTAPPAPALSENTPLTPADTLSSASPKIIDITSPEDAVPVYAFAPVFTVAPAAIPAEEFTVQDPSSTVPVESTPNVVVPPSATPDASTPVIVVPTVPETVTPITTPEQPPMTSGQIPPAITLPELPIFPTWAPPVANTPPSVQEDPGQKVPVPPILTPAPDPVPPITLPTPPEVKKDPTPPVVIPAPPESSHSQEDAPVIPTPIVEQPPRTNAPVVPPPVPVQVQPPQEDTPVIPAPTQNDTPVVPTPTPPEVQPPQDNNPPQQKQPPQEDQKPKQNDPPAGDNKPDEKPKDDNKDDKSDGPDINIEDSKTDCAPGTLSLGRKKTNDGKAEMCAVIGLPSSSRESTPGDSMYIKGANGLAIVNASFSDNISRLVQRAEKDGKHLNALSSYRSYKHQKQLCDDDTACSNGDHTFIAAPGHSEHGDGGAVDLDILHGDKDNCVWDNGICTAPHDKDWMYLKPIIKDYGINQYSKEAWHLDTKVH